MNICKCKKKKLRGLIFPTFSSVLINTAEICRGVKLQIWLSLFLVFIIYIGNIYIYLVYHWHLNKCNNWKFHLFIIYIYWLYMWNPFIIHQWNNFSLEYEFHKSCYVYQQWNYHLRHLFCALKKGFYKEYRIIKTVSLLWNCGDRSWVRDLITVILVIYEEIYEGK